MSAVAAAAVRGRPAGPRLLDLVIDDRADLRLIGLMRMLFGAIVIRHFWPTITADRLPAERFITPWWDWLPVPGVGGYELVLWTGVVAGALMIVGLASRLATVAAFGSVLYLLVIDLGGFAHNRAYLTWMLFGLALLPTGRSFALDAVVARRRRRSPSTIGFTWPLVMLRVVASTVYLTSATTKLLNPDWVGGLVLWDRTVRTQYLIPSAFDGWIHDVLVSRWFHRVLSPAALATEFVIGIGLWFPRTRRFAIATAFAFHLSIEITASVQTFSYSGISALIIWLIPIGIDRDQPAGRSSAVGRASTGTPSP